MRPKKQKQKKYFGGWKVKFHRPVSHKTSKFFYSTTCVRLLVQ